ncbi:hypothetical protein [Haloprofundus salilacus]|uniref:hypothetical protein n=1 Tax=Haloprofundus salilacus TaxID=2876190 RepID=UPI001CCBC9FC|nr:hypothetical protein [Haloprofundus salilacus]
MKTEAASIGLKAVRRVVLERLGVSNVGSGVSYPVGGPIISIHIGEVYDHDGEIVSEQVAPFKEVVEVTPSAVTVPLEVAGKRVSHTIPVEVEETTTYFL